MQRRTTNQPTSAGKTVPFAAPGAGDATDTRRLYVPKLFEPVAHSSGCTSPAQECADLGSPDDWKALADDNQPTLVRHE
jgi:hypothetical protein